MKLDHLSITEINNYLDLLYNHLPALENSQDALHRFWCSSYDRNIANMSLSMGLFLLHPAFHKRMDGTNIELKHQGDFTGLQKEGLMVNKCQIGILVEDAVCAGTKTVSDHNWPKSLGGPTRGANHLELCGACNGAKSNSILLFNWKQDIIDVEWIGELLRDICGARGGCN
jgi:hypothetical protein